MLKWLGKEVSQAFYYTMWGMLGGALTLITIGILDKLDNK